MSTSGALALLSMDCTRVSGKLCWGPSERTTVSSSAAACSSKSKETQNRLRRARPSARLMRPPKGAWMISCEPSLSSKQRSTTMPLPGRQVAQRRQAGGAVGDDLLGHLGRDAGALLHEPAGAVAVRPRSSGSSAARRSLTASESSAVRAGASPSQKGMVGGRSPASWTRTVPTSTLATRHECVPRRKMSPAVASTAKSSCTEPTVTPSGSSTTR